jgi:hypothetical protein
MSPEYETDERDTDVQILGCLALSEDGRTGPGASATVLVTRAAPCITWQRFEIVRLGIRVRHRGPIHLTISDSRGSQALCSSGDALVQAWAVADMCTGAARIRIATHTNALSTPAFEAKDGKSVNPPAHFVLDCAEVVSSAHVPSSQAGLLAAIEAAEADHLLSRAGRAPSAPSPGARVSALLGPGGAGSMTCRMPEPGDPPIPALRWLPYVVPWEAWALATAGVSRYALFGAGSHTAALLPLISRWLGSEPAVIVVSDAPATTRLGGVPVVAASAFDPRALEAILLSSVDHERAMAQVCSRWPGVRLASLWHPIGLVHREAPAERRAALARRIVPWLAAAARADARRAACLRRAVDATGDAVLRAVLDAWLPMAEAPGDATADAADPDSALGWLSETFARAGA